MSREEKKFPGVMVEAKLAAGAGIVCATTMFDEHGT